MTDDSGVSEIRSQGKARHDRCSIRQLTRMSNLASYVCGRVFHYPMHRSKLDGIGNIALWMINVGCSRTRSGYHYIVIGINLCCMWQLTIWQRVAPTRTVHYAKVDTPHCFAYQTRREPPRIPPWILLLEVYANSHKLRQRTYHFTIVHFHNPKYCTTFETW